MPNHSSHLKIAQLLLRPLFVSSTSRSIVSQDQQKAVLLKSALETKTMIRARFLAVLALR